MNDEIDWQESLYKGEPMFADDKQVSGTHYKEMKV